MSLKFKLGALILFTLILLSSLAFSSFQTVGQLQEIASRRRYAQIMLTTSEKLVLGKLVLQSDLPERTAIINQLLNDTFLMEAAVDTSLQFETEPEIVNSLQEVQLGLPAIALLLKNFQSQLASGKEFTENDLLQLNQLDGFVEAVKDTTQRYENYLKIEAQRIERIVSIYTYITIIIMLLIIGSLSLIIYLNILTPINNLIQSAQEISKGNYETRVSIKNRDEFGQMGNAFNEMTSKLREFIGTLEQRVADRTRALQTSIEVTRRLAAVTNPRQLVVEVVEQVQSAFHYYHTHIYFVDEATGDMVMAGGTGEAGAILLARGHRIPKGRGLVGRAAETKSPVLIEDVSQAEDWLPNPLLPETKSEAAVPILSANQVLGVLDVQQNVVNGLSQDDVELLQSLAGQIAISLQNARSYEESRSQAELETMVNLIGQKIQRAASVEETLQMAVRELGAALGAARVKASIGRTGEPRETPAAS